MIRIALRMLVGDRPKYFGILIGLTFASLLITQQAAIFVGLMSRTYSFIDDTPLPDLWIMDREVEQHADNKPLQATALQRVRGIDGVEWAMPMIKKFTQLRLPNGQLKGCILIGVDDATLIGAPGGVDAQSAEALRKTDGVLVDAADLSDKLAMRDRDTGGKTSIHVGDTLELNDRRAAIVGTFSVRPSFFWDPILYTTYSRASGFLPAERRVLNYIMVKAAPGTDIEDLRSRIQTSSGLKALTPNAFRWMTVKFIMKQTGIAVNFGIAVMLGFLVGTIITGQTFYNFTIDNLKYFGALKAMGTGNAMLIKMVVVQSLFVGLIGYGLGVGGAAIFGRLLGNALAFQLPWHLLVLSAAAVLLVCILSAILSVHKVLRLEPAVVFK